NNGYTVITQADVDYWDDEKLWHIFDGNDKFVLGENISIGEGYFDGFDCTTFDGNGHTITFDNQQVTGYAIYVDSGQEILITNVKIDVNGTEYPYYDVIFNTDSDITLSNVIINNNCSEGSGIKNEGSLTMDNSVNINAAAKVSGGGIVRDLSKIGSQTK
ncbi:MAG: hypothetical protein IKA30_02750, partial [Alphaproteobacteria bacterium]|nr:hypothetical protein [Alphaproteobacteria bacterium]